jgi:hypothetical protein
MWDDLMQVIDGASRILERSLSSRSRVIANYALVPFHDPGRAPRRPFSRSPHRAALEVPSFPPSPRGVMLWCPVLSTPHPCCSSSLAWRTAISRTLASSGTFPLPGHALSCIPRLALRLQISSRRPKASESHPLHL